jgi:hypothetical protein
VAWDLTQAASLVMMASYCVYHTRKQARPDGARMRGAGSGAVPGCSQLLGEGKARRGLRGPAAVEGAALPKLLAPSAARRRVPITSGPRVVVNTHARLRHVRAPTQPPSKCTWGGWTREAFEGWTQYITMAVPSMVMICE